MTTIIAGRFEQQDSAQSAAEALARAGFAPDQISVFFVTPAGQHDQHPLGGDRDQSPGAEGTGVSDAAGAAAGGVIGAAVGAIATPIAGPIGPITGALVGGHIGQVMGAMGGMKEDSGDGSGGAENRVPIRLSGMVVAVAAADAGLQDKALRTLRELGASDLESAEGTIVAGDWQDFDPVAPPNYIEPESRPAFRPHAES
jgi:hypothetical protein